MTALRETTDEARLTRRRWELVVAVVLGASFFREPPPGYRVPGFAPSTTGRCVAGTGVYTLAEALRTPQWYLLTTVLTLNVTCGLAFHLAGRRRGAHDRRGEAGRGPVTPTLLSCRRSRSTCGPDARSAGSTR